jgi:hypothetical protein
MVLKPAALPENLQGSPPVDVATPETECNAPRAMRRKEKVFF